MFWRAQSSLGPSISIPPNEIPISENVNSIKVGIEVGISHKGNLTGTIHSTMLRIMVPPQYEMSDAIQDRLHYTVSLDCSHRL